VIPGQRCGRIERIEQVDVGRGDPTIKRKVGRADGEVQLEGDQDTERSARHPRLLFSVWASSGKGFAWKCRR